MISDTDFATRFNRFLYRQNIRKLGQTGRETAREWCVALIRREYPHFSPEQVDRFYDNLIQVQYHVVDEWTQRMS
jgi:hypothetical protein